MADSKLTALDENTNPALEDLLYSVDDPGGTPVEKSVTVENVNRGLVLLESVTVEDVASIDMENWYSAEYDEYQIEIIGLTVATDAVDIYMLLSTDGGSTWESTNYNGVIHRFYETPGDNAINMGTSEFNLTTGASDLGNDANFTFNGSYKLFHPGDTSKYKMIYGNCNFINQNTQLLSITSSGYWADTTAVNAFQIIAESGNITGSVRVYGIRK